MTLYIITSTPSNLYMVPKIHSFSETLWYFEKFTWRGPLVPIGVWVSLPEILCCGGLCIGMCGISAGEPWWNCNVSWVVGEISGVNPVLQSKTKKKFCVEVHFKGSCVQWPITIKSEFSSKALLTVWVYISFTCLLYFTTQQTIFRIALFQKLLPTTDSFV